MGSKQYTLIVAIVVIVVLGLFFLITSRSSDVVIENPNTINPVSIPATSTEETASSSPETDSSSTTTINGSTTINTQ